MNTSDSSITKLYPIIFKVVPPNNDPQKGQTSYMNSPYQKMFDKLVSEIDFSYPFLYMFIE